MNIGNTVLLLQKFEGQHTDVSRMVKETCDLARDLIDWNNSTDMGKSENLDLSTLVFKTNDPAPPFNYKDQTEYANIETLQSILLNEKDHSLFTRYRALFTLRELYSEDSCRAICQTLTKENFENCSALLKHEVAFVLA